MKKKKGKYFVHLFDKKNRCYYVEEKEGYIISTDCGIQFGCTKEHGGWNVTEITTGFRCIIDKCPNNMESLIAYIEYITPTIQRCLKLPCREKEIERFNNLIYEYQLNKNCEEVQV